MPIEPKDNEGILSLIDKLCDQDFIKQFTKQNNNNGNGLFEQSKTTLELDTEHIDKQILSLFPEDVHTRYSYAKIMKHISSKKNNSSKTLSELPLQIISENLNLLLGLFSKLNDDKYDNAYWGLYKLKDQIDLEIYRIEYQEDLEKKSEIAVNQFEQDIKNIKEDLSKISTQYVTILGIFAAIILAFVSGLVFSSSVLQNIDKVNIYKLSLITLTIGFFITNILLFLFNFIKNITKPNENKSILDHHFSFFNLGVILLILMFFAVSVSHEAIYEKHDSNSTINVNTANISFSPKR